MPRFFTTSEYMGIDGGELIEPKCLSQLEKQDSKATKLAFLGILKLWNRFSGRRTDDVIRTRETRLSGIDKKEYFLLLITHWLESFNSDIQRHLKPVFNNKHIVSEFIRGDVDFVATEIKNAGLVGAFDSNVTDLEFNIPELMVLRDAVDIISVHPFVRQESILSKKIWQVLTQSRHILREVPPSGDPKKNAQTVSETRRKDRLNNGTVVALLPPKLRRLASAIELACEIVLSGQSGLGGNGLGCDGLVFNMNYLLEYVVQEAMAKVGGCSDASPFNERRINRIEFVGNGSNATKIMRPDCFGVIKEPVGLPEELSKYFNGKGYIIDAKHKFFHRDDIDLNHVQRGDFYQIISYAATHYGQGLQAESRKDFMYGLIGLSPERSILENITSPTEYFEGNRVGMISVCYDIDGHAKELNIGLLPLRFASFLYSVGLIDSEAELDERFKALGRGMLETYFAHVQNRSTTEAKALRA